MDAMLGFCVGFLVGAAVTIVLAVIKTGDDDGISR